MHTIISDPKFAYFMGAFAGDGSFYRDSKGFRFEICDGTSVKKELKFSKEFLLKLKFILDEKFERELKEPKKKGNQYILKFRLKLLAQILQEQFKLQPGYKSKVINIPKFYIGNPLVEKFFWLGIMDTDGMIARKSRKITLWSASKNLINSFKEFLIKNEVIFCERERLLGQNKYFGIEIKSPFIQRYAEVLSFNHPRKRLWLEKKLLKKDFYLNNNPDINGLITTDGSFNFAKIFDTNNIYIVNGKFILKKFGIKRRGRKNIQFIEILELLRNKTNKKEIYNMLLNCRWKMSKGSTVSIKVPLKPDKMFLKYAKFARIHSGGLRLSRNYIKAFNENPDEIVKYFIKIFDIRPTFTSKGEILFNSGVLVNLFSKIMVKK